MRDDERYPTVVDATNVVTAPEVATVPQIDPEGRDKVVTEIPAGLIPVEEPLQSDSFLKKANGDTTGYDTPTPERRYCGLRRKTFLISLAILAIVLIAAVVGGVVGGLKAKSSSSSDDSPTATSSSVPISTGPIDADERQMAAAIVTSDGDKNIQVFYNNLDTTNILYRRVVDDEGSTQHSLELDIEPSWGAPIAATAQYDSSTITTKLFYITTADNETQIAQAVLDCGDINSSDRCSVSSNDIISSNLTRGVHPESKLAALHLSNDSMRVFFQANGNGSNIWVLHSDDDDWTGSNLVNGAMEGTSLAASAADKTSLHVFFVSKSTERLAYVDYSDILGATADPESISNSPGSSWSPSNAFSSVYVPKFESYRVYYTNPSTGNIVSYFQNTTTPWASNHDNNWGSPDSSIASVAWSNQVRLLYFEDDKLVMSAQNASVWSEATTIDN